MLSLIYRTSCQLIIFLTYKMENNSFNALIDLIRENKQFDAILRQREEEFLIKIYKISELNELNIIELYNNLRKKFYYKRNVSNQEYWYENQLRIFIYLFFAYLECFHKQIDQLVKFELKQKQDDWHYFSIIFNYKKPIFFEFQALSIVKNSSKAVPWTIQETELLKEIIEEKKLKNRWNSIARQLFIRSHKTFFRNPKQCRQRWMNHLDPSKIRTQWSVEQDFILLNCIKKKGKKWSSAVKQLNNTRTEHMVKNRYKSLIYNQSKKQPTGKRQSQLQTIIIKRISKCFNKSKKLDSPKIQEIQTIKIKELPLEKHAINSPSEQILKIQQKVREDFLKLEQFQPQNEFYEKMQDFNEQFYKNSPIFIPWRGNMRLNELQGLDLNSEEKLMMDNDDDYGNNEEESQNFFKA